MSCHSQQRGSSVRLSRSMTGEMEDFAAAFATPAPAMRKMEKLSEKSRELHNQQPAPASSPLEKWKHGRSSTTPRGKVGSGCQAPRLSMVRRYRRLLPLRR
jgi:hypothetical protein